MVTIHVPFSLSLLSIQYFFFTLGSNQKVWPKVEKLWVKL